MALKTPFSSTSGQLTQTIDYRAEGVTKGERDKKLVRRVHTRTGRNAHGHITVRHRGGGSKKLYRAVDFKRDNLNIPGRVEAIEYDPYRTAFLLKVVFANGERRYLIAPQGVKVGDEIVSGERTKVKPGNSMLAANVPLGTQIHCIELTPGRGAQIVRSAGTSARLVGFDDEYAIIELPSKEMRRIRKGCRVTVGVVSNQDQKNVRIGKAGRVRWSGRRPQVLGKSMNAVDHPHGGGEGHAPIGLKGPKTPWGKPARGVATRRDGKASDKLIIRRRPRGKSVAGK